MVRYRDLDGDSGIEAYRIGDAHIDLQFKNNKAVYRYFSQQIGVANFEMMKRLAEAGEGLHAFINKNKLISNSGRKLG